MTIYYLSQINTMTSIETCYFVQLVQKKCHHFLRSPPKRSEGHLQDLSIIEKFEVCFLFEII